MEAGKKKVNAGLTLIELMVVIAIVGVLASIAIPIYRGRIDAAKWAEGRAMVGTVATAIRAYHAHTGRTGAAPTSFGVGAAGLGFSPGDLTGTFFMDADFSFEVTSMDPLTFTITATKAGLNPPWYRLDQNGNWTP